MNHKWKVVGVYAVIFCVCSVVFFIAFSPAQSAISKGAPEDVLPGGWLTMIVSALGAGGSGVTVLWKIGGIFEQTLVAVIDRYFPSKDGKPNATGEALKAEARLGQRKIYAMLYNSESDPEIQLQIRTLAKVDNDAQFNRDFPMPTLPVAPNDSATINQMVSQLSAIHQTPVAQFKV